MATWDPPSDAELDVDKPIKAVDIRRIRDLSEAMADGAAGAPSVGGLKFISSTDLSSDATADFTGFDAASYDSYIFDLLNVIPATDSVNFWFRTSTNGGSTYDAGSANYAWACNSTNPAGGRTGEGSAADGNTAIQISGSQLVGSAASEDGWSGRVIVHGPHLTKSTRVSYVGGYDTLAGDFYAVVGAGMRVSSADVDAVRFLFASGNLESGTITMYGVANA